MNGEEVNLGVADYCAHTSSLVDLMSEFGDALDCSGDTNDLRGLEAKVNCWLKTESSECSQYNGLAVFVLKLIQQIFADLIGDVPWVKDETDTLQNRCLCQFGGHVALLSAEVKESRHHEILFRMTELSELVRISVIELEMILKENCKDGS